ncbi:cop9 complex subunit 7a [Moniliophthora roreri MCA 2997]|uniref:Cop9 complex subunit 7a n=2 Tax=Moniliophthora roreri TaxID=221103 RepID=V2WY39_MONRO|nr:cop9 complex subunit 7a [Moniliophthora roreri MCA 2997]KAI3615690.1 cop9 complex subunit 7a [Moniliophthora roreri]
MELGSNFSAKLEPFLLMGKTMKGAAAAKLIQDATSAPGVFVFSELLELPNIQELGKSEEHEKFLSLLQLFAYKTYQDYLRHQDKLPPLTPAQIVKLKQLSIVTLAAEKRILPYNELMNVLQTPTIRELEDLIIDAIYLDLLRGKLDQKEEQFEIEYTMGRDLEPGKVDSLLVALKDWASTTSAVLRTLDEKIQAINNEAAAAKVAKEEQETEVQTVLKELQEKAKDSKQSTGSFMTSNSRRTNTGYSEKDVMRMDVDEPAEPSRGKNRKAPQAEVSKPQRKRNRL